MWRENRKQKKKLEKKVEEGNIERKKCESSFCPVWERGKKGRGMGIMSRGRNGLKIKGRRWSCRERKIIIIIIIGCAIEAWFSIWGRREIFNWIVIQFYFIISLFAWIN